MGFGRWAATAGAVILIAIVALSFVYSSSIYSALSPTSSANPALTMSAYSGSSMSPSLSSSSSTSSGSFAMPPPSTFTHTPSSTVKVLEVNATTSRGESGDKIVTFTVEFENIGSVPIYVLSGGGSPLSASIISGPVTEQAQSAKCEIAEGMTAIGPSQSYTSLTPGCWSGYVYELPQSGTIQVLLILIWSNGLPSPPSAGENSIQITAEFTLS
jgi:hypothetical protein